MTLALFGCRAHSDLNMENSCLQGFFRALAGNVIVSTNPQLGFDLGQRLPSSDRSFSYVSI